MVLYNTHPFNGPLSRSTRVSRYKKGETNLDFTGTRDSEWQWHQLGHMQVCTSLQTDNHANTHLERGAHLHVAQLMPLPLTVSCFSKIQIGFTFLVPAHPGSPGKRAVKWYVCVCNVCIECTYF